VLNADDPSYEFLRGIRADAELSYGMATCALVSTLEVAHKPDITRFVAVTPVGRIPLETYLVGEHNVMNVLAAVSVGLALRLPVEAIQRGVQALKSVPGRWERIDEGQGFYGDCDFCHTPNALEGAATARRMTKVRSSSCSARLACAMWTSAG
jgi:UDP-N-acetylmuramoyl-L-alanyl-D-glutamate--2,6-diaminopimelate ligase